MFEKFLRDEINTDVLAVIGEDTHNHHPKQVVALDFYTK
jgi:hypothetical protein